MLRGATVVPALALLVAGLIVPGATARADVPSEQSMGEGSGAAVTTTLVLRPICTSDDMQRFAVVNDAGPATRFTVEVEATTAEPLAIGPGETVRFWVDAAHAGPVEITWPDGSASATPADDACAPEPEAAPPAADPEPEEPAATASVPSERDAQERPEAPAPPESVPPPTDAPAGSTAGSARDAAGPEAPDAAPPARDTGRRQASAAAPEAAGDGRTTPRPRPSQSAFACPDHWMAVDSDGDGTISGADECELVVETGAAGGSKGALFATAALIVTVGLLIASVTFGAVGRRRMSPR